MFSAYTGIVILCLYIYFSIYLEFLGFISPDYDELLFTHVVLDDLLFYI